MEPRDPRSKRTRAVKVPTERTSFRQLLSINPNYFGTLEGAPFKPVLPKQADPTYEELTCVGYSPARAELEATFAQKLGGGYNGGPCSQGSREYVRLYADEGAGWVDVGVAGVRVTDLPPESDCAGDSIHPLSHTLTVGYAPDKWPCTKPRFIRVRAILSWSQEPPAGSPDWPPVWGSVHECTVQIPPRPWIFLGDLADKAKLIEALKLPDYLIPVLEAKIPIPPPPPEPIVVLAQKYAKDKAVPPSRFAFKAAMEATAGPSADAPSDPVVVKASYDLFKSVKLDLSKILTQIEKTAGNVQYEELGCVGLDNNRERLVATFRVKLPSGYSGPLCGAGSKEYVAFWADWDDTCQWTYLGTTDVAAHDFVELPDGGLCYSAVLPVDLDPLRRSCEVPRVARIRAVLSWNGPPSPGHPDAIPTWGNRVDTHVRVLPGVTGDPGAPKTWITLIGGVNVTDSVSTSGIHPVTGLTTMYAAFGDAGVMAGAARPFGGWIVVRGPSLPGHTYRVLKRTAGGGWSPMTDGFRVIKGDGTLGPVITPSPADGTVAYLSKAENFTNLLGRFRPAGDEIWEIRLEVIGLGFSPVYRVQLDNTRPDVHLDITSPGGTCGKFPVGSKIKGTFDVHDLHLRRWSLSVPDPAPADGIGVNLVNPSSGTTPQPAGSAWELDTTGMRPCGYNIVLEAWDRIIYDSHDSNGNYNPARAGFCLE